MNLSEKRHNETLIIVWIVNHFFVEGGPSNIVSTGHAFQRGYAFESVAHKPDILLISCCTADLETSLSVGVSADNSTCKRLCSVSVDWLSETFRTLSQRRCLCTRYVHSCSTANTPLPRYGCLIVPPARLVCCHVVRWDRVYSTFCSTWIRARCTISCTWLWRRGSASG